MTIRIEIQEGRDLAKKFRELGEKATRSVEKALVKGGLLVERDAKILCPVDTGRLRASITHRLEGAGSTKPTVLVGTNVEYAPYVEFGHGGREVGKASRSGATLYAGGFVGKPYLFPALRQNRDRIKELVTEAVRKEMSGK